MVGRLVAVIAASAALVVLALPASSSTGVSTETLTLHINEKIAAKTIFDAKKRYTVTFSGTVTFTTPGSPALVVDALFHGPCSSPGFLKTTNVLLTDSRPEILAPHVIDRNIACRDDHRYVVTVNAGPHPDLVGHVTLSTPEFVPQPGGAFTGAFTVEIAESSKTCRGEKPTIVGEESPTGANTIIGTPRDDVILGTDESDLILGGGGNDLICAEGGDDHIDGGGGNDFIHGSTGNDALIGGVGDATDFLYGESGADRLKGGSGADTLRGGAGNDVLMGGPGAKYEGDELRGGPGNDELISADPLTVVAYDDSPGAVDVDLGKGIASGADGRDTLKGPFHTVAGSRYGDDLTGDDRANELLGREGYDKLFGRGGSDRLHGSRGNDLLDGGAGDDHGDGGPDEDTCRSVEHKRRCELA